jgi:hypothetical protein
MKVLPRKIEVMQLVSVDLLGFFYNQAEHIRNRYKCDHHAILDEARTHLHAAVHARRVGKPWRSHLRSAFLVFRDADDSSIRNALDENLWRVLSHYYK